jgi:hypothetical protein
MTSFWYATLQVLTELWTPQQARDHSYFISKRSKYARDVKGNDTNTSWNTKVESEGHPTKYEEYSGSKEDSK